MKLKKRNAPKSPDTHGFRKKLTDSQKGHVYGVGTEIYTDGSSVPNPGKGRYGFIVLENNKLVHEYVSGKKSTTVSEMEVNALLAALEFVAQSMPIEKVVIHTDSGYCHGTYNSYMHTWAKKNWKVNKSYMDEWKRMYELYSQLPYAEVKWVEAHAKNEWNNHIDRLIGKAQKDLSLDITGPISKPEVKVSTVTYTGKGLLADIQHPTPPDLINAMDSQLQEANSLLLRVWENWCEDDPSDVYPSMKAIGEYIDKRKLK